MIPVYNAPPHYLEQALRSVLQQDPGSGQMQIEVIDHASTKGNVAELVHRLAGNRIFIHREPQNQGIAYVMNRCIERASGQWVHILHGDDWVLPGFYARFETLIQATPKIDAAFSRYIFADSEGRCNSISSLEMGVAGELKDFSKTISVGQRIQCASVIVNRSTYERLGGYRTDLPFTLDWEMWCRIAATGCWGYVPEPGAVYRKHTQSETERLLRSGKALQDVLVGGRIARAHFSRELQNQTESDFRNAFASYVLENASALYVQKATKDARQLLDSFRCEVLSSNRRWDWLWLRLRVFIKPLRLFFSDT